MKFCNFESILITNVLLENFMYLKEYKQKNKQMINEPLANSRFSVQAVYLPQVDWPK